MNVREKNDQYNRHTDSLRSYMSWPKNIMMMTMMMVVAVMILVLYRETIMEEPVRLKISTLNNGQRDKFSIAVRHAPFYIYWVLFYLAQR